MRGPKKVAFGFFNGFVHSLPRNFSTAIDQNTTISTINFAIKDEGWEKWIGQLKWKIIEESNLFIKIQIPTSTPEIINAENNLLEDKIKTLYCALKLLGNYWIESTM
ncbi:hypothetical protein KKB18_06935, partial [bacterium]|nr:hypothetical protein [bacterium]